MIPVECATQPHVARYFETLLRCYWDMERKLHHNDLFQQTIRRKQVRICLAEEQKCVSQHA